jgi:hypothetical protein
MGEDHLQALVLLPLESIESFNWSAQAPVLRLLGGVLNVTNVHNAKQSSKMLTCTRLTPQGENVVPGNCCYVCECRRGKRTRVSELPAFRISKYYSQSHAVVHAKCLRVNHFVGFTRHLFSHVWSVFNVQTPGSPFHRPFDSECFHCIIYKTGYEPYLLKLAQTNNLDIQKLYVLFFGAIVDIYPEVYKMLPLDARWDETFKLWRTALNTHGSSYFQQLDAAGQQLDIEFQVKKLALQFLIHSLSVVFPLTQDVETVRQSLREVWSRNSLLLTRTVRQWNSSSDIEDSTESEGDYMEEKYKDVSLQCQSTIVFEDGTKIYYEQPGLPTQSVVIKPGLFEMDTSVNSVDVSALSSIFKGSYFEPHRTSLASVGCDLVKQTNIYLTSTKWTQESFTLEYLQEQMELVFLAALQRTVNRPYTTKHKVCLHRYNTGEFELSRTAKPIVFFHQDDLYISDTVTISSQVTDTQTVLLECVLRTLLLITSRTDGCRTLLTVYKFYRRCVYVAITQLLLNNQMRCH